MIFAAGLLFLYKLLYSFFFLSLTEYRYTACFVGQSVLIVPALYCLSIFISANISEGLHGKLSLWLSRCTQSVFLVLIGLSAFILTFSIYSFLFHRSAIAFNLDEIGYLFQARNFISGKLYSPAPQELLAKFFDTYHVVIHQGKIFGRYPFGHSVVLMVGILAGALNCIPPLIAALNVIFIYYVAREVYDKGAAVCASLLCLLCPYFLCYSSTLLSEGSSLLLLSLVFFFFVKFIKNPHKVLYPLLCGFFLGIKFNVRPISAVSASIPFMLYALYLLYKAQWLYVKGFVAITLSFSVMLGIFLLYNYSLTGDPLLMPYTIYAPHDRLGFGPEMGGAVKEWGEAEGHTVIKGLKAISANITSVNQWIGWGFPLSLLLSVVLFIKGKRCEWDWLSLGIIVSILIIVIPYWCCSNPVRALGTTMYYFEMVLPLSLLSGHAIYVFIQNKSDYRKRLVVIFMILTLVACLYSLRGPVNEARVLTKSYRRMSEQIQKLKIHHSIIFVQTEPNNSKGIPLVPYHNDPSFGGDIVYGLDLGYERNRALIEAYPDRNIYLWEKNSLRLVEYNHG